MLRTLDSKECLSVVNGIIEYMKEIERVSDKPCYMELIDFEVTPEFVELLEFVGLDYFQTKDSCVIAWKDNLDKALYSINAEREYKQLRNDRNLYGE